METTVFARHTSPSRWLAWIQVVVVLIAPGESRGQEFSEGPLWPAPALGIVGGLAPGPAHEGILGLRFEVPVWRMLSATAEFSTLSNGVRKSRCSWRDYHYANRCSSNGLAGLSGLSVTVPLTPRLGAYGQGAGGLFSHTWFHTGERANSSALSLEAGLRLQIHGRMHGGLGARYFRVFDDNYERYMGETLEIPFMTVLVVQYRLGT
jgi:hypothetical protein